LSIDQEGTVKELNIAITVSLFSGVMANIPINGGKIYKRKRGTIPLLSFGHSD
jgi:hypothetical protein